MQNDDTLSWSYVEQILHTRALNRSKNAVVSTSIKPFQNQGPCKTCHNFNGRRDCNGMYGYLHACYNCRGNHPMSKCYKSGVQAKGNAGKHNELGGHKKSSLPSEQQSPFSKDQNKTPTPINADQLVLFRRV